MQLRVRGTLQTLDSGPWDMQQLFCPSSYSPSALDKLGHFALSWSSGTQRGLCRYVDSTKLRNIQQLTGETRPGSVKRASILQN